MTIASVVHAYVNTIPDVAADTAAGKVTPTRWNAAHTIVAGGSAYSLQYNNAGAIDGFGSWDGTTLTIGVPHADLSSGSFIFTTPNSTADPPATLSSIGWAWTGTGHAAGSKSLAYLTGYNAAAGQLDDLNGVYLDLESYGGGSQGETKGIYALISTDNASSMSAAKSFYSQINNAARCTINTIRAFYSALGNLGTVDEAVHFWGSDLTGLATNGYFLWSDSPGVFRVKSDGVMAYYNPAFTKYTPGATNHERIVQQWNANVAEYGPEAGGTGTQRALRLIGASTQIANLTTNGYVKTGGGNGALSVSTTVPASDIANAAADGATKGVAAFAAADFNATTGVISIDYSNGQVATASVPGFLSAADFTTFSAGGLSRGQAAAMFTACV